MHDVPKSHGHRPSSRASHRRTPFRIGSPLIALVGALAVVAALIGAGGPAARGARADDLSLSAKKCTVSAKLVPSCGLWWGVSPGMYKDRALGTRRFEAQMHARVDIYHAYHFLGNQFPTATERSIANQPGHHRMLLLDYVPDGRSSWAQVAKGSEDAALRTEALYLKSTFKKKLFISIHHEPEDEVRATPGSGYTASDFAAMFRHVVEQFRAAGVTNVVWVFNIMGVQAQDTKPWFNALYPGDKYVDWIAADPYGCINLKVCKDFNTSTINQRFSPNAPWPGFYRWSAQAHPNKPIMLAEWGAYTNSGQTARLAYLRTLGTQLKSFPRLKALVYWNSTDKHNGDVHLTAGSKASLVVRSVLTQSRFSQNAP